LTLPRGALFFTAFVAVFAARFFVAGFFAAASAAFRIAAHLARVASATRRRASGLIVRF